MTFTAYINTICWVVVLKAMGDHCSLSFSKDSGRNKSVRRYKANLATNADPNYELSTESPYQHNQNNTFLENCPVEFADPSDCKTCSSHLDCGYRQSCCHAINQNCCTMNATTFQCPQTIPHIKTCKTCNLNMKCNSEEQCCGVGDKMCCLRLVDKAPMLKSLSTLISRTGKLSHTCPSKLPKGSKCVYCIHDKDCQHNLMCCLIDDEAIHKLCCVGSSSISARQVPVANPVFKTCQLPSTYPALENEVYNCIPCDSDEDCEEETRCCTFGSNKCCLAHIVVVEFYRKENLEPIECPNKYMSRVACKTCFIDCTEKKCCNIHEKVCCIVGSEKTILVDHLIRKPNSNSTLSTLKVEITQCPSNIVPFDACVFCFTDMHCSPLLKCCNILGGGKCCMSVGILVRLLTTEEDLETTSAKPKPTVIQQKAYTCPDYIPEVNNCEPCGLDSQCSHQKECCNTTVGECCIEENDLTITTPWPVPPPPNDQSLCPRSKIDKLGCLSCQNDGYECLYQATCCLNFNQYCCVM